MSRSHDSAATRYLRKLSFRVPLPGAEALEAATMESLSPERAEEACARAVAAIERESGQRVDATSREELDELLLEDGKEAIERLKSDGPDAQLTDRQEDALEAIVEVDGSRPTLAVLEDDRIDLEDESLGQWRLIVNDFADPIARVAASVGRIDLDGSHKGTGFVVGDGFVLTNRHVLQELATQGRSGEWEFKGEPTITFDANPEKKRSRQFEIQKKVVLSGPEAIDPFRLDYNKLDFAVLECVPSGGQELPEPLYLESDADKIAEGRPVFVIGYPAKPAWGVYSSDVLQRLFQYRYGVKRFSPGEIDRGLGSASENTGETVFAHDSTTLGGNSGSCVVDLGNDGRLVVGLHFAGAPKTANYAHSNARLRESLTGPDLIGPDLPNLIWKEWIQPE